jgi:gamma-glutamyl-gamma-aminobutyrate hydrolase PuuD
MDYALPFRRFAEKHNLLITGDDEVLDVPGAVALAVFTGGEDVDPSLYGKSKHRSTHSNIHRDNYEKEIFNLLREQNVPMAGICRGAQFLCVMAGGQLIQDVTGHAGYTHPLMVSMPDGNVKKVAVNSAHHQMQNPFVLDDDDYELVGWCEDPRSKHYVYDADTVVKVAEADDNIKLEPDIVFYPKINALGAQYHPEWLGSEHEGFILFEELLGRYIEPLMTNDEDGTRAA